MPLRTDTGLIFPLCGQCAKLNKQKCDHTDAKRAWIATSAHIEVEEALRQGYTIDRVYKIWHYTQWDSNLFKEYVRTFLKIKVESSGWPVKTDGEKKDWMAEYKAQFDITLNPEELDKGKNAGKRYIAKLCLNS